MMSYYGAITDAPRRFSLHREDSTDSLSAPLFTDDINDETLVKSYGSVTMMHVPPAGNGLTLGKRLQLRHELVVTRRIVVNIVCALALLGIVLMVIETELFFFYKSKITDDIFLIFKMCISASTVLLLLGICVNYYIEHKIKALDAGVWDWYYVIADYTWFYLFAELLVCSFHPFPGDLKVTYASLDGTARQISIDAFLSSMMMARLYLTAQFVAVNSSLLTDTSTTSIGALSKIKINTIFVFKAAMTNHPSRLLISVMITTFLVNSWAMYMCEKCLSPTESITYVEVIWLIAITFLTVGYGDTIPLTNCGRCISIFTGVMGVGSMALLVAIFARKLEQTRSERYVFNMVTRIQIENRRKTAAANVIKAVIRLCLIKKDSANDKTLRRKFQDRIRTSTRQLRQANIEKANVGEFNVGIIEVSEAVNRIDDKVERIANQLVRFGREADAFEDRYSNIEKQLDDIKTMLR